MSKKILLSYCSENYKDAFDFVVPSWIKCNMFDEIVIYTDTDKLKYNDSRVKIINHFLPNKQWIVGTGRRLEAIEDYILKKQNEYDYLCFLDMDCYIVEPFHEIFHAMGDYFDIALTRLISSGDYSKNTATAGVFFMKNNWKSRKFVVDWIELAKRLKLKADMIRDHKISYVQYSFTKIALDSFHNLTDYKIINLSEKDYNSERSSLTEWYQDIRKHRPKVLHFKGNRYKDRNITNKVFSIYKEKTSLEKQQVEIEEFSINKDVIDMKKLSIEELKELIIECIGEHKLKLMGNNNQIVENEQNNNIVDKEYINNFLNVKFNEIDIKKCINECINEILSDKHQADNKKLFNYSSQIFLFQTFKEKFVREVFPKLKQEIMKDVKK